MNIFSSSEIKAYIFFTIIENKKTNVFSAMENQSLLVKTIMRPFSLSRSLGQADPLVPEQTPWS